MDMTMITSIIMLVGGGYCIYSGVMMKNSGIIPGNILLPKGVSPKSCKDKEAYIASVLPSVMILGIVLLVSGALDLVYLLLVNIQILCLISTVIAFLALIWYAYTTAKAAKKYF